MMQPTRPSHIIVALIAALLVVASTALGHAAPKKTSESTETRGATTWRHLSLQRLRREPVEGRRALISTPLANLRAAVARAPRDRADRFALVQALRYRRRLREAIAEAKRWRRHDAYNLVVVRLLGDLYSELGDKEAAQRAYSAVVELLPEDPTAQRALATVLKQSGQLRSAYDRLVVAAKLRPADRRIAFELADTAQRLGRAKEAIRRFAAIVSDDDVSKAIAYPAKQRLGQLYARARNRARRRGQDDKVRALAAKIDALNLVGGVENDIKIYLTWDTNRTDVDLWVTNPSGEKIYYRHTKGRSGGALFHDVTDGYGPESFTAKRAVRGSYLIEVNYYGAASRSFSEARGEVTVVLHEGTPHERRYVLPYRLFSVTQTVTVARVHVR